MQAPLIVPLSGGYDSTAVLYRHLAQGLSAIPVYVRFSSDPPTRRMAEDRAVPRVLDWLRTNVAHTNLVTLSCDPGGKNGWSDIELVVAMVAFWMRRSNHLTTIGMGYIKDEDHDGFSRRRASAEQIGRSILNNREITFYEPLIGETKQEVVASLPKELMELCWTCRNPMGKLEPCGKCVSCRSFNEAIQGV